MYFIGNRRSNLNFHWTSIRELDLYYQKFKKDGQQCVDLGIVNFNLTVQVLVKWYMGQLYKFEDYVNIHYPFGVICACYNEFFSDLDYWYWDTELALPN